MVASADDSGSCGNGVTYIYVASTHTLTISGNGYIQSYDWQNGSPWHNYGSIIQTLIIEKGVTSIGSYAFDGCSGLTEATIPSTVTSIRKGAFRSCSSLKDITIPNSITSIGENAFSGCSSLTSVTIPSSVTSIGVGAFQGCSGLTSITIPNSVTSIGNSTFGWCSSLSSVTIPSSVKSIESYMFSHCSGLKSVNIPSSVTSIGGEAFCCCTSLTSITIPNSVFVIGSSAFYGCTGLTNVNIPNSVEIIGMDAFWDCSCLKSITIPSSVTSIGEGAFHGCWNLDSVIIQSSTPPLLFDNSFSSYSVPLKVPSGCLEAYQNAQGWSNFTNVSDGDMYYQLSITATGHGTATCGTTEVENATTTFDVAEGANATITITPDDGYSISSVIVGGVDKTSEVVNGVLTLSNVTANVTVAVTFAYGGEMASVAIGSTGMATYCSTSDLDFSEVDGLKAYIGAGFNRTTGKLTMLEVTDVPAGTGLVVKGSAGTYEVPVKASASIYANLLEGVTTATNISQTADGYTNYILGNGANGVGFYLVSSAGGSLSAGKAYLRIPTVLAGSRSVIDVEFSEGVTGIDDAGAGSDVSGDFFTLSGQRLEGKPTKAGMYVKDGRVVIIK